MVVVWLWWADGGGVVVVGGWWWCGCGGCMVVVWLVRVKVGLLIVW